VREELAPVLAGNAGEFVVEGYVDHQAHLTPAIMPSPAVSLHPWFRVRRTGDARPHP
jgi:hypothetical protein